MSLSCRQRTLTPKEGDRWARRPPMLLTSPSFPWNLATPACHVADAWAPAILPCAEMACQPAKSASSPTSGPSAGRLGGHAQLQEAGRCPHNTPSLRSRADRCRLHSRGTIAQADAAVGSSPGSAAAHTPAPRAPRAKMLRKGSLVVFVVRAMICGFPPETQRPMVTSPGWPVAHW